VLLSLLIMHAERPHTGTVHLVPVVTASNGATTVKALSGDPEESFPCLGHVVCNHHSSGKPCKKDFSVRLHTMQASDW
jgi:hypothetical protein